MRIDVPSWKTSPSYPPQSLLNQFVPASAPGYQQYIADNPGAFPASAIGALFIGRTFGWGGFPGTGSSQEGTRRGGLLAPMPAISKTVSTMMLR